MKENTFDRIRDFLDLALAVPYSDLSRKNKMQFQTLLNLAAWESQREAGEFIPDPPQVPRPTNDQVKQYVDWLLTEEGGMK